MTDKDILYACKRGKDVFETQLREAAPLLAARHEKLLETNRNMRERFVKEQARIDFEEDMRRELATELRRVRLLFFAALKELPMGNVIRTGYTNKYDEERPRWA